MLPYGALWGLVGPVGACWGLLGPVGACWGLAGPAGACYLPSNLAPGACCLVLQSASRILDCHLMPFEASGMVLGSISDGFWKVLGKIWGPFRSSGGHSMFILIFIILLAVLVAVVVLQSVKIQ